MHQVDDEMFSVSTFADCDWFAPGLYILGCFIRLIIDPLDKVEGLEYVRVEISIDSILHATGSVHVDAAQTTLVKERISQDHKVAVLFHIRIVRA